MFQNYFRLTCSVLSSLTKQKFNLVLIAPLTKLYALRYTLLCDVERTG